MEINIEDYMSKEEIREIVLDEVRNKIKSNSERLLGNMPYHIVQPFIQEIITSEDLIILKEKVKEQLHKEETINYHLFKEPDLWDSKKTIKVSTVIQNTIEENLHIVKQKAINSLENIDEDKMTIFLEENMHELISAMLYKFGGLK